jgi:uncharacterized Ntn-hydrolase superfamily protein
MSRPVLTLLPISLVLVLLSEVAPTSRGPEVNTFSIVAYDADAKEWGVGVASKYLAVGSVVPWAQPGVGAIATQAFVNAKYGPDGLDLLAKGKSAEEAVKELTDADRGRDFRQLGIVDGKGKPANFTGEKCNKWAGGQVGKEYCCQGNLLTGEAVVADMARAFEKADGPLAWRIMTALEAAEKAGGDRRGKQSAALYVVRARGGDGGSDRAVDLRVDDHDDPLKELARILAKRLPKK